MPVGMLVDYTGRKVGHWTFLKWVEGRPSKGKTKPRWLVRCDCGTEKTLRADAITCGRSISCGCIRPLGITARTAGLKRTYQSWRSMVLRCTDPKDDAFQHYGARGIVVCSRWQESYQNFLIDMGECPENYSIERIEVNGNYEPNNCIWIHKKRQAANRRNSRIVEFQGQTFCLLALARLLNVNYWRLSARIRSGKSVEEAVRNLPSLHPTHHLPPDDPRWPAHNVQVKRREYPSDQRDQGTLAEVCEGIRPCA